MNSPALRQQRGFTLIELMIVVVIVAILALIAYPSYTEQVREGRRPEYQGKLMDLATSLEGFRARNFKYTDDLSKVGPGLQNDSYYTVAITTDNDDQAYVITATPKGGMDGDGVIKLDSQGRTCFVKGAASCTLSSTSSWHD